MPHKPVDSKLYLIHAVNLNVLEKTFLQNLRFSQQSFRGFRPSGMWLVADVWKEWHNIIPQMNESSFNLNLHLNLDEELWFSLNAVCCYNLTFFMCFGVGTLSTFMFLLYWKFSCADHSFICLIWRFLLDMHSHINWLFLQAVPQQ